MISISKALKMFVKTYLSLKTDFRVKKHQPGNGLRGVYPHVSAPIVNPILLLFACFCQQYCSADQYLKWVEDK